MFWSERIVKIYSAAKESILPDRLSERLGGLILKYEQRVTLLPGTTFLHINGALVYLRSWRKTHVRAANWGGVITYQVTDQFIFNRLSPLVGGVTWTSLIQKRRQSLFFPPLSSSPLGQFALSSPAELRRNWPKRDCSQSILTTAHYSTLGSSRFTITRNNILLFQ